MQITEYRYGKVSPLMSKSVCALGFFDGVHLGHRHLIGEAVKIARARGFLSVVFTFPTEDMRLKSREARLYTTEEKIRIFDALGVDITVVADFGSVSSLSEVEFIRDVLCRDLGCVVAVSGEDFRFGKGATGDSDTLSRIMKSSGGEAVAIEMEHITLDDGTRVEISSSLIRAFLANGQCDRATALLGEKYHIRAVVDHGLGLGKSLGFPTLNTDIPTDSPLGRGVYMTEVEIDGVRYPALTNIGTCPTIMERQMHAETYIIGYDGDLYDREVTIYFTEYIRAERTFETKDALIDEVMKNIDEVKRRYGR